MVPRAARRRSSHVQPGPMSSPPGLALQREGLGFDGARDISLTINPMHTLRSIAQHAHCPSLSANPRSLAPPARQ